MKQQLNKRKEIIKIREIKKSVIQKKVKQQRKSIKTKAGSLKLLTN